MAQQTVIRYFSDLSGDEIKDSSATVPFALEGTSYEIDLTAKEADELQAALAPYIAVARKTSGARRDRPTRSSAGPTAKEIRAWAVENGHDVPAKGRIPAPIREAYDAAH